LTHMDLLLFLFCLPGTGCFLFPFAFFWLRESFHILSSWPYLPPWCKCPHYAAGLSPQDASASSHTFPSSFSGSSVHAVVFARLPAFFSFLLRNFHNGLILCSLPSPAVVLTPSAALTCTFSVVPFRSRYCYLGA